MTAREKPIDEVMMPSLREFFTSRAADRLMDRSACPPAIDEFLRCEQMMLEALTAGRDLLVEVGCMDGRHLGWAVDQRKRYVGIDLVPRHIQAGRRTAIRRGLRPEACQFLIGAAEDIDVLLARTHSHDVDRGVVFFPFNVFGAVSDPGRVMEGLRRSRMPFLISAYQTTEDATACRHEYYRRCGYAGLRMSRDERGVCFATADGFRTMAYHPEYLQSLWRTYGVVVTALVWSRLNVMYAPRDIAERR